ASYLCAARPCRPCRLRLGTGRPERHGHLARAHDAHQRPHPRPLHRDAPRRRGPRPGGAGVWHQAAVRVRQPDHRLRGRHLRRGAGGAAPGRPRDDDRAGRHRHHQRGAGARHLGPGPDRPEGASAGPQLHVQPHRDGCDRVHHRHRHPLRPRGVRGPCPPRLRRLRRRPERRRLPGARHARGRYRGGEDLGRGEAGEPGGGAGAELRGERLLLRHHGGDGLGGGERDAPGRGEHVHRLPRAAAEPVGGRGHAQPDRLRRHRGAGGGERRSERRGGDRRLQQRAGRASGGDHRGRQHAHRPAHHVVQLRRLRHLLRARLGDHLGLARHHRRLQEQQRHLDGLSARGRRGGSVPGAGPPGRARHGEAGALRRQQQGRGAALPHHQQPPAAEPGGGACGAAGGDGTHALHSQEQEQGEVQV
ncbi:MAG: Alkaline serine exoprotease A precursor, partial [uncultured Gemmatimonadetes bacterium]